VIFLSSNLKAVPLDHLNSEETPTFMPSGVNLLLIVGDEWTVVS
jgi:hypothetical protein